METDENKQDIEIKLDRKSKIFFLIFAILILVSVGVTYYRYMVKRDYIIQAQIDCDPTTENCFIWKCDPNSMVEGEECTGVPDKDIWYYKVLHRNAKNIPNCDPKDESCTAYVCGDGEKDCADVLCAPANVLKGEECNDPVKYNAENPPEEDDFSNECAPDDEECQAVRDVSDSSECSPDDENCAVSSDIEECNPDEEDCSSVDTRNDQAPQDSGDQGDTAPSQP